MSATACAVVLFSLLRAHGNAGEHLLFKDNPLVEFHVMATGFTWETQDRDKDIAAAVSTWEKAKKFLMDKEIDVVLLDELTYMLTYGYLDKDDVIAALKNRPPEQHVIVTGRNASKELVEIADTVSDINDTKHAFNNDIKAQKGIDY